MGRCSIEGCDKPRRAATPGLCPMHYRRFRLYGDPLIVRQPQGLSVEERFWSKVDRTGEGCWEWTAGRNRQGYGQFGMDRGGPRWETVPAHRVAWELTYGPIPEGMFVCHHCDNPPCCRPGPDHLFLGTSADNAQDRDTKGRGNGAPMHPEWRARGEKAPNAKLTEDVVRRIREEYGAGGVSQQELADRYGVNQTKISAVVRRVTWKHVVG